MAFTRVLHSALIGFTCLTMTCVAAADTSPVFTYDAQTGILSVNADLDAGTTLVSWLVPGPQATSVLAFENGTNSQGSDWIQGYFDNKEQWIAITGNGITGSWDIAQYTTELELAVFGQVEYALRYEAGGGVTEYTTVTAPALLPGDLNSDGFVGLDDLDIVLGHWNQSVPAGDMLSGDPTGDGFVGLDDLDVVLGNWNASASPASTTIVPEPVSAWFVISTVFLARRR